MFDLGASTSSSVWFALIAIAFLVHFAEEYWGGEGYPAYLYRLRGVALSKRRFVILQAMGFTLIMIAALISTEFGFSQFMILILSGLYIGNGISHTVTAFWDRHYGPGLYCSIFLWPPIGIFAIWELWQKLPEAKAVLAVSIGLALSVLVALMTLKSAAREITNTKRAVSGPLEETHEDMPA